MQTVWRPESSLSLFNFVIIICDPKHQRANNELSQLSVEDRKPVFEDLAGSSEINPEEAQFVAQKLEELDRELAEICNKPAFDLAQRQSPQYIHARSFKLMFLRSQSFNPRLAASQMTKYLQEKLDLFGEEKLTKNIRLVDLSEDDLESVSCGGIQVLYHKDTFGRKVVCYRYDDYKWKTRENWLRAMFYFYSTLLEDEETQIRGFVSVPWQIGTKAERIDYELMRMSFKLLNALPVRMVASHVCADSQMWAKIMDLAVHMASPFVRLRIRCHYGGTTECLYRLMTFGIPMYDIPWMAEGELKTGNHRWWLEERMRIEGNGDDFTHDAEDDDDYDDDDMTDASEASELY